MIITKRQYIWKGRRNKDGFYYSVVEMITVWRIFGMPFYEKRTILTHNA